VGCICPPANTYINFVQGLVTKARDGLASDVEQYAREIEESEGSGSLKDGATLLEVVILLCVDIHVLSPLCFLFQRLYGSVEP